MNNVISRETFEENLVTGLEEAVIEILEKRDNIDFDGNICNGTTINKIDIMYYSYDIIEYSDYVTVTSSFNLDREVLKIMNDYKEELIEDYLLTPSTL